MVDPYSTDNQGVTDLMLGNPYRNTIQPVPGGTAPLQPANTFTPNDSTVAAQLIQNATPPGTPGTYGAGSPNDPAFITPAYFAQHYTDQGYATALVQKYARVAGTNPSLQNDPNYWVQKITSGALGTDISYVIQKFMQPEGAPAGGGTAPPQTYVPGQGLGTQGTVFNPATNPTASKLTALQEYLLNEGTGAASANPAFSTDPNSPILKSQIDAFRATQTQNERTNLASIAERAGPNTNIGAETRLADQQAGQAVSGYQAQLMGTQLAARQNEILQALNGASGSLTAEQAQQLEEELAQLQLAQQAFQFDATNTRITNLGV